MNSGVLQGGGHRTITFLNLHHDLPNNIQTLLILYADGTTSILHANTNKTLLIMVERNDIQHLSWFQANGLTINPSKI